MKMRGMVRHIRHNGYLITECHTKKVTEDHTAHSVPLLTMPPTQAMQARARTIQARSQEIQARQEKRGNRK